MAPSYTPLSPIPSSPTPSTFSSHGPFRDDSLEDERIHEDMRAFTAVDEKGLRTTGAYTDKSARRRGCCLLAKLVGFFFVMITLFLALVSDTKPLTTSLTSSLPKHIQPFVDSVYSTLRFSSIDHTVIEGGDWARSLYDSLVPRCPKTPTAEEGGAAALTRMYDGPEMPRTAFASFPRSGNTYTRELVERATGFRTSSSYCDPALRKAFLGECSRGNGSYFFRKTHYPALRGRQPRVTEEEQMDYDRAVQVVRNPLDAVFSYWQWHHVKDMKLAANKSQLHEMHDDNFGLLGSDKSHMHSIIHLAERWRDFHHLWEDAPIPRLTLRYEDLRTRPLPSLLSLVSYLLPPTHMPSLSSIACSLTLDPSREAYVSSKSPLFASWDRWSDAARKQVLEITAEGWCRYGYEEEVKKVLGDEVKTGIDCSKITKAKLRLTGKP